MLVDEHDYHTFQPLLYQVATDLLETRAVGHPLRDLFHDQPNAAVHQATVTAIDLDAREVEFAEMAPLDYDYLVLALGAQVELLRRRGRRRARASRCTRSRTPCASRSTSSSAGRRPTATRRWSTTARSNVVVVGGGPTGVESVGALAELYRSNFAKDYPSLPQEKRGSTLVEAGAELFAMFKPRTSASTRTKTLEKRGVEVLLRRDRRLGEPTRVTLKSGKVLKAHTLVWGAGLRANPLASRSASSSSAATGSRSGPTLRVAGHPEVFAVGDVAWITDTKTGTCCPQLGSVALQAGEHAGENIARLVEGKDASRSPITTRGRWPPSAAALP